MTKKTSNGVWERSGPPIRMLTRESAVCSVSKGNDRMEISADHSKMVKFRSKSDEHYQRVVVKIKEIMENHEKKLSESSCTSIETTTPKAYDIPRIMSSVSPLEPYNRHQDIRHKPITSDECRDKVGMTTVAGVPPKDQLHFMVPSPRNEDFIGESNIASWFKAFHKRRTEAGKSQHTGHLRLALCRLGGIGYVLETKHYLRSQLIPNR
jgi:hypothetical protein